jgi:predicted ester cyclase
MGGFRMSVEQNKAAVKRYFDEVYNEGKLDVIDEVFAERSIYHRMDNVDQEMTRQDWKAFARGLLENFPGFHATYEEPVAEGDRVVYRWIAAGTNRKTGEQVTSVHICIYRLKDCRITDMWVCFDRPGG